VNSHPGNVAFRGLVRQHRTAYFAASTRKSDKARIATEIIAQVHSLPGRFLQQADGKTHKWVEINEKRAKKKVGQVRYMQSMLLAVPLIFGGIELSCE